MRSSTVLSVALVAAAIVPVMSAPVASQPTQTAPAAPPYAGKVDGFLESLSPAQLQQLSTLIQVAENDGQNGGSPTPTATSNPSESNHPEKRQFGAIFGKAAGKAGAKIGEDKAKGAIKSAAKRAPTATPVVEPFHPFFGVGPVVLHHDKPERRSIIGTAGKDVGKEAAKYGEGQAAAAIQSALKRAPAPTSVSEPIFHPHFGIGPVVLPNHEPERRSFFGTVGKDIGEVAAKYGEGQAEAAIKSALKRAPAPFVRPFPIVHEGPEVLNERDLSGLIGKAKSAIEGGIADLKSHLKRSDLEEMDERDLSGLIDEAKSTIEGGIADLKSHLKRFLNERPFPIVRPEELNERSTSGFFHTVNATIKDIESHFKRSPTDGEEVLHEFSRAEQTHHYGDDDLPEHVTKGRPRSIIGDVTGFVDKAKNTVEHDVSSVESDIKSHLKRNAEASLCGPLGDCKLEVYLD
ncbi:hypothetical protein V8E55_004370 [Tylopilus felleus]